MPDSELLQFQRGILDGMHHLHILSIVSVMFKENAVRAGSDWNEWYGVVVSVMQSRDRIHEQTPAALARTESYRVRARI